MFRLSKYILGLDTYERHNIVSRFLHKSGSKSVLDVGGTARVLQMFSDRFKVTTINVDDSGDVRYAGKELPYADDSFDAVVSLDTLEHIPREDRKGFVEEMLRVAKREAIFCTPFGTEFHRNIEIELHNAWRREFGKDHRFLKEHIDYVLPTLSDIKDILAGKDYELLFVGDVKLAAGLFRNYMRALKQRNSLVRRFYEYLGLSSTLLFHSLRVTDGPSEFTNRVYAHVRKTSVKQEAKN